MSGTLTYGNKNMQMDQDEFGRLKVIIDNPIPLGGDVNVNLPLSADGYLLTTLMSALSKDFDSIDVGKMSKAGSYPAFTSLSGTSISPEVDCRGFNAILLHVVISGNGKWKFDILNSTITNGEFIEAYDYDKQLTTGEITTSRCVLLKGVGDYIKVRATEITDGSACTVKVQPLNA